MTEYEDMNRKNYEFNEQITIETMIKTFLRNTNSNITLELDNITFIYKSKILNSSKFLNKHLREVFKREIMIRIPIKIKVIDKGVLNSGPPIVDTFIKFNDYKYNFVCLHKKISDFFDENYSSLYYDNTYKNKFIDFINSIDINYEDKSKIIEWVNPVKSGTVKEFIQAYTGETPLCYWLNKWLRECDRNVYDKIKYFAGPFSYSLYKYANDNSQVKVNYSKKFYRKIVLKYEDYEKYKNNIGELICYPAFTSVSEEDISKYNSPESKAIRINNITDYDSYVVLIINYKCNNSFYPTPCIDVSFNSNNSDEKEYIFPPFSFFRIEKVENRKGSTEAPHIIYLSVANKRILIEFAIKNNRNIYYDQNLNELYAS